MENHIELMDYISVEHLQSIQESFADLVGVGASISDENGSAITSASGMCDFCKYTRVSPIGNKRCRQCDAEGAAKAYQEGKPVVYTCHAGLVDFVAPIIVDGKQVGCFVGGQVRFGDLDEEKVKQTAIDIGVNPMMYLQLAKQTRVISKDVLKKSLAFIQNVTNSISEMAYKQYQIEMQKQEVEYAAKLKSDFLANMSHEIRTPMNGVIGLTELALMEDMPESVRSYLNQIQSSGRTLLTIINDILDFSKIESGKMEIIPEEYDPYTAVAEVTTLLRPKVLEKKLELVVDADFNIPCKLYGDSIRIRQVVTNLANNAVKFTQQGKVTIVISFEKIGEDEIDMTIKVKDTGIGISEENIGKLFKSFQQVDSKRNRAVEGTGLGLAISKQLITLMGGEIGVESVYGEGSTFYFHLPQKVLDWTPLHEARASEGKAEGPAGPDKEVAFIAPEARVLVVDDNEVNLTVASGLLKPLKMQIETAMSGSKALEMVAAQDYDLIFMDHMMPDMDGIETTHAIRTQFPKYENIPIIALTANIVEGSREMFLNEGLNDYVGKPIDFKVIVSKLRKWLPESKLVIVDELETEPEKEPGDGISIPTLDTAYALGLLGTEALFMKVLKDYFRVIDKKASLIQTYYDQEDWKSYTIEVHALKSASRQIGATELSSLAADMEKAGNEGAIDLIRENTERMLKQYLSYKDILAPFCAEEEAADKPTVSDERLIEMLDALAEASDDLDMVRMEELMKEIKSYAYTAEKQPHIEEIGEAAEMMDVDTCIEKINEFKEALQS